MGTGVRQLEMHLLQAASPVDRLGALLELAETHADAFHDREGLRASRDALVLARGRGDSPALGRALAAATTCHYQRGDYVAAVATGLDAVDACADGDLAGRSSALRSIALALHAVEATDLALAVAGRAVADAVALGESEPEAAARDTLALVLLARGRHREARAEYRRSAALHRKGGHRIHLKKSIAGLAHTYRLEAGARGREAPGSEFALRQALRVYAVARAAGESDADDAIVEQSMAECRLRLGEQQAAWTHIARAVERARRVASPAILAECHLWEAHVLREMGELQAAERACERACVAAEPLVLSPALADVLQALAAVHDAQGRFERASDAETRSRELRLAREASLARVRTDLGPLWEQRIEGSATSIGQARPRGRGR